MNALYTGPLWVVIATILVLAIAATEIGFRYGRYKHVEQAQGSRGMANTIRASIIGLIALLLGFSFSITTSRFQERGRLVLDEANALETCYLRAGLLAEPARSHIRNSLRHYTDFRIEYVRHGLNRKVAERATKGMDSALIELWAAVTASTNADHEIANTAVIVPAANDVINLDATRAWAINNRLPSSVVILLGLCMMISGALIGHSSAEDQQRHVGLWIALNVLVMLVVFVILDFDRPRRGIIKINHRPLTEVREMMTNRSFDVPLVQ